MINITNKKLSSYIYIFFCDLCMKHAPYELSNHNILIDTSSKILLITTILQQKSNFEIFFSPSSFKKFNNILSKYKKTQQLFNYTYEVFPNSEKYYVIQFSLQKYVVDIMKYHKEAFNYTVLLSVEIDLETGEVLDVYI